MRTEINESELKKQFVQAADQIKLDPALWGRIEQSTRDGTKRSSLSNGKWRKGLSFAAAALAALLLVGFTPGGKAMATQIAEKMGLRTFVVTDDKAEQIKSNGVKIDVDKLDGPVEVNGLVISPANPDASGTNGSNAGAILEQRDGSGTVVEKKIETKEVVSRSSDGIKLK